MLVLGPLVADYFNQSQHQANALRFVENTKASDEFKLFHLRDRYPMDADSYIGLAVGVVMVGEGIWGTLKRTTASSAEPLAAANRPRD